MTNKQSRRTFVARAASVALAPAVLAGMGAAAAQPTDAALDELARQLADSSAGTIVRPGQPDYAKIKAWNGRFDCVRTKAYLRPTSIEGVRQVVAWARRNRARFAIRGGGHSFEGKSSHPDLVVDMSRMKRLAFDGGVLTVEAGALLGDIYKATSAGGHVFPGGTCPSVGIVGHALGGGIGDFLPIYGYAAQALREVTLVTLSGTVLRVDDQAITVLGGAPLPGGEGLAARDLMRVLRGGGQGSLGIVVAMKLSAFDVRTAKLASFRLEGASGLSASRAGTILQGWFAWRDALPEAMRTVVSAKLNLSRSGDGIDLDIAGVIVIPAASAVTIPEVRRTLNRIWLPEFGTRALTEQRDAARLVATFLDGRNTSTNPDRQFVYGSSSALERSLSPPAIQHLLRSLDARIYASLYTAGGRANQPPATSLHGSDYLIEWTTYADRRDPNAHRRIRDLRTQVMQLAGLADRGFPNYPDDGQRDYLTNRAEVERVRALLDPDGLSTSSLLAGAPSPESSCR